MGLKRNAQTGTPVRVFRGSRDSAGETQYTYEGLYAVKDARRVGDHLDASGLPLQQHSPNAAGLPSHKRALQMEQGPPMQQDNIQQGLQIIDDRGRSVPSPASWQSAVAENR
eukprot:scaffold119910_cov20-Tisochrysis_lutea.AAC.2